MLKAELESNTKKKLMEWANIYTGSIGGSNANNRVMFDNENKRKEMSGGKKKEKISRINIEQ